MNLRVILITGANGGLGQAFARAFLQESPDNVVWLGVRANREQADKLAQENPDHCFCANLDVTSPESWQSAVKEILARHQRLDVLVNNAGSHDDALLATMPPDSWRRVLATNLDGVFHGCQAALPTMISQRSGRIVNVSSLSALLAPAGQANYAAAKAGVVALTQSVAKEVARIGITINAVCPGFVETEVPVRLAELGTVYRYERSGVLHGLLRVRGFTQDDAHIFCTPDQIESEVEACIDFAFAVMKNFGFDKFEVELSDWDAKHPENYAGKPEDWHRATNALASTMSRMNIPYKKMEGEAAFYGPKIDVKLIDAIGRPWQLTTVQFDFNLPARFELQFVGVDGAKHQPLMVHRALLGSVERFFGILIEHYAGAFPLWLAPTQVEICPVSEKVADYAKHIYETLKSHDIRVHLDDRNEKLPAKIRDAQLQKIPYMLVVGPKEAEAGTVSVRHRSKGDLGGRPIADLITALKEENNSRAIL